MKRPNDSSRLETLVRARIDRWRAGDRPNAAQVLTDHPELLAAKSLVLDLGLAEFSLRTAAGDEVGRSTYCEEFPAYQQSLAKLLEVHEYLDRFPEFAIDEEQVRWPAIGDEFFGYEIVEPLGRGGWARVFLAREIAVGNRFVVIKVSRFGSCEADALGKLSHPSIVPIHSVLHGDGWTVICMPLVGVATAIDLLDAAAAPGAKRDGRVIALVASETRPLEPVSPPAALERFDWKLPYADAIARLGLHLADGLAAAHAAGILHRDIKPSNILLSWSGRPMLLDFNLAAEQSAVGQTVAGTLAYMAPELVESLLHSRAAAGAADPRCDVFSLGAVLYELLTGRLPHEPANAEKLPLDAYGPWLECKRSAPPSQGGRGSRRAANLSENGTNLSEKGGRGSRRASNREQSTGGWLCFAQQNTADQPIDARLTAIVLKCLAFNANNRYASAAALAADLRSYLGTAASANRFVNRNRRAVLAAALGLIGASSLFAAYIGSRPSHLELLYQRGLAEYDAGDFPAAAATFTHCLELKSGWPNALFGRGQALRRMNEWAKARTDYTALRNEDAAWSYALAGYCNMQLNDDRAARGDFLAAYENGLRDIGFLFNYARTQNNRQMHSDAAQAYSEVLSIDPHNKLASRNRALSYFYSVRNHKSKLPNEQAFADIETYRKSASDSFEAPFCAAIIYGEAARKDASYEDKAIGFLTEAIRKGLPLEWISPYSIQLKRLLLRMDAQVIMDARRSEQQCVNFSVQYPPAITANWQLFEMETKSRPPLLAQRK